MTGIYGALGLPENDRTFVNVVGQTVVYEAAQQFFQMHNADLMQAYSIFVQETTSDFKRRYKLPGGGRLQRITNRSRAGASRALGAWDVAFPLESFGSAYEFDRVSMAYLTVQQFNNELLSIRIQDINTRRFEMLKALFNNVQDTFVDPIENVGTIKIEPLANGDAVLYPPVIASETEATENHYIASGYVTANISDTNNPLVTIRDHLEHHFGTPTGYGNIVVFCHPDEEAKLMALTDFIDVTDMAVSPGNDTDTLPSLPNVPGRILGRCNGVWVVEWRWILSTYLLGMDLDQPAPLIQRVDPPETGLGTGLILLPEDTRYPIKTRNYENRFGVGCGNRLNGVVVHLTAGGFTVPTIYQ